MRFYYYLNQTIFYQCIVQTNHLKLPYIDIKYLFSSVKSYLILVKENNIKEKTVTYLYGGSSLLWEQTDLVLLVLS